MRKFTSRRQSVVDVLIAKRKAAGLSQRELSKRLGKVNNYVHMLESGRVIDVEEFVEYALACGADPVDMLREGLRAHSTTRRPSRRIKSKA